MNSILICLVAVIAPSIFAYTIITLEATLNKGEN